MPNANRRRGAYSGWTRRRGAAGPPPEPPARLERTVRRGPPADTSAAFPRKGAPQADEFELTKVVVFCLDEAGRVLTSGEVAYTSRDDLARQLADDVRRYPVVEAWQGCICLLRLGGPVWPAGIDDEF